ncbi:cytochrome P450 9e2-like [Ptiloglossa arizonensis]|uniref:cytochrome P450 9e2-like n=1 Tax=Ptiloglossa arizonensis TaxID=3350558 RepID=UPI003F9F6F09
MDLFVSTVILLAVFLLVRRFLRWPVNRFEELGIPYEPSIPILGNMAPVIFRRVFIGEHVHRMYNRFSDTKYFGFHLMTNPVLVIRDPELIASIAVKNFDNFTDHLDFANKDADPMMGKMLFFLRGDHWREMRKLLTPAFTGAKMKIMFDLIVDCADRFTRNIANESKDGKVFDLEDIFGRYGTDVIATTSFGIAVDSMRNPDHKFYVYAKQTINMTFVQNLKLLASMHFRTLTKLLGFKIHGDEIRRYFTDVIAETVRTRKEKGIYRPDVIQLMMESRDTNGRELTLEEMRNQAFGFYQAGYGTGSTFLAFVAHEIAMNPDVRSRLRAEIEEVASKHHGKPTYDTIKEMPYLNAVVNETNRLYPVSTIIDRTCVKEFELPPATPDSKPVVLKPGDMVIFMPFSIQRDPKYFPEPLRFDPDRFLSGEVPQNHYFPFGIGPRACIGNRFAIMEVKIAIFYLLLRCDVEPCSKTQHPIRFSKKTFVLSADNGFWLSFKARKEASALAEDSVGVDEV